MLPALEGRSTIRKAYIERSVNPHCVWSQETLFYCLICLYSRFFKPTTRFVKVSQYLTSPAGRLKSKSDIITQGNYAVMHGGTYYNAAQYTREWNYSVHYSCKFDESGKQRPSRVA